MPTQNRSTLGKKEKLKMKVSRITLPWAGLWKYKMGWKNSGDSPRKGEGWCRKVNVNEDTTTQNENHRQMKIKNENEDQKWNEDTKMKWRSKMKWRYNN